MLPSEITHKILLFSWVSLFIYLFFVKLLTNQHFILTSVRVCVKLCVRAGGVGVGLSLSFKHVLNLSFVLPKQLHISTTDAFSSLSVGTTSV